MSLVLLVLGIGAKIAVAATLLFLAIAAGYAIVAVAFFVGALCYYGIGLFRVEGEEAGIMILVLSVFWPLWLWLLIEDCKREEEKARC